MTASESEPVGDESSPGRYEPAYPEGWEADVVLRDGSVCHIRPLTPDDADRLRRFHAQLSPETIYYRYFAPYPELTQKDVRRFTHVDYDDRVGLAATVAGEIVGIGRYDRIGDLDAEVAFTVRDDYQNRGLGSVLLEHIAAAARERGVRRFVADVLPQNRRMVGTFTHAGYRVAQELEEGIIKLAFEIETTETMRSVMQAREQRAEARSIERILNPRSVAVIGASRRQDSLGNLVLHNLLDGGFDGRLFPIHRDASIVAGLPAYKKVADAPKPVDLAIVVVPVDAVPGVVEDCAAAGVHALIVISAGYSDSGPDGIGRERELVSSIRGQGMRLVGPNALGVINTDPRANLCAAVPNRIPPRGRVAVYGQSAPLSMAALDRMAARRLGISSSVSVGNRADVSGHDMLQYWQEDGLTSVVLLYVESLTNPSKFMRIVRSVTRHKPVVIVRSGRSSQAFPLGARPRRTELPAKAVDQLITNAGVIETESLRQLIDVGGVLACQPLPTGNRVTVVGDAHELMMLTSDACTTAGMNVVENRFLRGPSVPLALRKELEEVLAEPQTDAVIVVHVPAARSDDGPVRRELLALSQRSTIPLLAVLHAEEGNNSLIAAPNSDGGAGHGSVPYFGTVEEAVEALRLVVKYAQWRRRPLGELPEQADIDSESARALVEDTLLGDHHHMRSTTLPLVGTQLTQLLSYYGIRLWTSLPVATEDEAVSQADEIGWPVVIKSIDPRLARRGDYFGIRTNIESELSLRAAYLSLAASLDQTAMNQIVVQRMAPGGIHCVLRSQEDSLFGPVVSFGLGGSVPELLNDRSYQVPPMSDTDAARMVRDTGSSRLLFGYGGREPVDVDALEDLVTRVGRMAEELPQLARLDLNPIQVSPTGVAVLGAAAWLRPAEARNDAEARRLSNR